MEKTFEEVLIDRINFCDWSIDECNYRIKNPNFPNPYNDDYEGMLKRYKNDEACYTFISRINDVMQLDIDDVVFRRTVGTFFTELIKEVMGNAKTD